MAKPGATSHATRFFRLEGVWRSLSRKANEAAEGFRLSLWGLLGKLWAGQEALLPFPLAGAQLAASLI